MIIKRAEVVDVDEEGNELLLWFRLAIKEKIATEEIEIGGGCLAALDFVGKDRVAELYGDALLDDMNVRVEDGEDLREGELKILVDHDDHVIGETDELVRVLFGIVNIVIE